jgi:glycosyltransferase involved in cell wall biosynthesis
MKIAILGTRGIPNYYSGFEQFAEYFSVSLVQKGHEVYCYNSHNHQFQEKNFKGVHIIHQYDPEFKLGTFGQFIYDLNCILDARKRNFDIILQLGYTSSSIWFFLLPKKPIIITNMDGVEWKRSKYSKPVQQFLKFAERLAAVSSDYLVADSIGIQKMLKERYQKQSEYIAYGAFPFENPNIETLNEYHLTSGEYNMLMARFEPENNLQTILDGVVLANDTTTFIIVGNHNTKFGEFLKNRYLKNTNIKFLGAIFNIEILNNLRFYSKYYFHGHSVGGTNPSLLEAMASRAFIVSHNNDFNKGILQEDAIYFKDAIEVSKILKSSQNIENEYFKENNYQKITQHFNWNKINQQYLDYFKECFEKGKK